MEKKRLAEALLVAAMVFAAAAAGWKLLDYHRGAQEYGEAARLAQGTPAGDAPAEEASQYEKGLSTLDLSALRETNRETVAWIAIPDTEIYYPVMQAADNSYYLNHTWNNKRSSVGAIFLECKNQPDFSGFNSMLYGHQMLDGSMFGGLKRFADEAYLREHPAVYLVTDEGVSRYDIFAAYETGVQEIIYRLDIEEEETRQEMIDFALSHSTVDAGISPAADEKILTLSTCTGRGYATRWVVQGVRKE